MAKNKSKCPTGYKWETHGTKRCTCDARNLVRNAFALHASMRKSNKFKDRREPRGGSTNNQRNYLDRD